MQGTRSDVYASAQWKRLRAKLIGERGRKCEQCGRAGFVILDHIRELVDGGAPFDEANLMLRCPSCHGIKTAQQRVERGARPAQQRKPNSGPVFA
jgi:5-methylcytosine-specific restriction endonuclease McrA